MGSAFSILLEPGAGHCQPGSLPNGAAPTQLAGVFHRMFKLGVTLKTTYSTPSFYRGRNSGPRKTLTCLRSQNKAGRAGLKS